MTTKNDMLNPRGTDYEHWKTPVSSQPQQWDETPERDKPERDYGDEDTEVELSCGNFERPHTPAPSRLNTQPKGCTCEDCIRFRDAECPYPDSNITMDRCNSFLLNIDEHDAAIARTATLAENKRVLDAIVSELEVSIYWSDTYMEEEPYRHILTKVESLRQSTTAAQEDEQP
jgi:hypothetical protein